jgi:ubiquinone/menaquinone biosynthesis C-methylase UbiE
MNPSLKNVLRLILPPILVRPLSRNRSARAKNDVRQPESQDLDIYWSQAMAETLENWGAGTVWHEVMFLLANCHGRVLDIACGTGKTIVLTSSLPKIEVHGCDISDMLIEKAREHGIDASRLKVCDATNMAYDDDAFAHSYSIGSLEHFTEDGILKFISECHRVTRRSSAHMIPVSRSGTDEGWMKTEQSFFNNSSAWWLTRFRSRYADVVELDSLWSDPVSVGKWFVCAKAE